MINFILALVTGGIMGWLASKVMNRDADMGIFANVIVGCVGSILGRWLLGMVGMGTGIKLTQEPFNIMNLVTAFIGAVVLLGVVNMIKRGSVR